jgi:3'-phosphoadenosine 5'-phosphosulfate sulfotransferase (PAPS reductase)/FAD synthetase
MSAFTKDDLKRFQAQSLDEKFQRSLAKIAEWFSRWNNEVYVSFSGGKDSTVLADICARWCKIIEKPLYLVFVNTGLEYPEIQKFVKEYAEYLRNKYGIEVVLEILRPKMRFDEVIKKYGYPIISKQVSNTVSFARKNIESGKTDTFRVKKLQGQLKQSNGKKSKFCMERWNPLIGVDFKVSALCCDIMKKTPAKEYAKKTDRKPITAQMTCESQQREMQWLKFGCNGFDMKSPMSNPMSFWTEQDVLQYIREEQLQIASVYGDIVYAEDADQLRIEDFGIDCGGGEKLCTTGCDRTGCIFCAFGCHLEKEPSRFQRLKQTHPRQYEYCIGGGEYDENGVWKPNKQGLGMGHVFDELNKIYGEDFIKY